MVDLIFTFTPQNKMNQWIAINSNKLPLQTMVKTITRKIKNESRLPPKHINKSVYIFIFFKAILLTEIT